MPSSPIVEVKDGAGPWLGTVSGVNVTNGNVISIRLQTPVGPTAWYLEIFGVDEVTMSAPTLVGVNGLTHLVATPATEVTFLMPAGAGIARAIVLRSWVDGGGPGLVTTFGIYTLTAALARVGAVNEKFEGDPNFGWTTKLNPIIRNGGVPTIPTGPATGDLGGIYPNPDVLKIHGTTVPTTSGADIGKVLTIQAAGVALWKPTSVQTIQEEGAPLAGGPHSTLNFIGAAITATDAGGGVANISVAGTNGIVVQDEGGTVAGGPHSTVNFAGAGVTATDAGGGVALVTIPQGAPTIQEEGSPLAGGPHSTLNFIGAGVTATDAGGGVASITIPQGAPTIQEEGSPLAGGPHSTLNFIGAGVTAANAGGGVASITIPQGAPTIQEEGVPLAGGPHSTLNFIGGTVTAVDAGGGVASITIGGITALPEVEVSLAAGVFSTTNAAFTRAGSRTLDPLYWPATIGALTRSIYFKADIEVSTGGTTANVRLQNITDNETVTGTDLSTGLLVNTEVTSVALTVGVAAGNLKSGTPKQYEIQVSLTGGGAGDTVTITNARLCVRYA